LCLLGKESGRSAGFPTIRDGWSNGVQPNEKVKILLVDDRPENLLALRAVLSRPDYELIDAGSGSEALGQLLKNGFALILLDAQMPEMDGFETATLIRQRLKTSTIPIIFVTAIYFDKRHMQMGYASGALDYITKPFDVDILKSKVAVFVDLYRKNQEIQRQAAQIQHERQLRSRVEALKDHYRSIINGLDHSIIWEMDAFDLQFLFVSHRAVRELGYAHEQWFQEENFFFNKIPAEEREKVRRTFRDAVASGNDQRCEHRMISRDNQVCWFYTGLQIEKKADSIRPTIRGITVDITALKQVEEGLRRREARYRKVIDTNMIGHYFADLETGMITDANDYFLSVVGYTHEELTSGKVNWRVLTPPEEGELDQKVIQEMRQTGISAPYEKHYIRKDGTRMPVMIGAALMHEPYANPNECFCFVLDLRERRRVEEDKLNVIRSREEMLEIVSHDLKNPLSAILMNAVLLFRKVPPEQDQNALRKQIETIQQSAERMKNLITDLMDLSKVEAGRLILEKSAGSPKKLLEEALDLVAPELSLKKIRVEKSIPDSAAEVHCDSDRMIQVFSNILGNAVKFTPEGGVIHIGVESDERETRFFVTDSGPGIPEKELPRIFDRYWQSKGARSQGSGLGLLIAKRIMEAHGGRLWAESRPGLGSTFYIALPRGERQQMAA
jgi:PAS domain S-box-containing protein